MRVLRGVVHIADLQCVAKFYFAKRTVFCLQRLLLSDSFNRIRSVISIESKWVYNHIKLRCDLEQNVTDAKTQFDMAVNPL